MKRKQTNFIASVRTTICRYDMLRSGDTVLVAVSGGPDSVALLHAMIAIRPDWSLRLAVAHLNHGLRKGPAEREAAFVKTLSESYGLSCEIGFEDVKPFSKKRHLSIQEGAREARYRFFRKVAAKFDAQKIALGHQADDNAESVLMHLLRGTGPRGLTGIPPVREDRFIRPLIETPRAQILKFLQQRGYPYTIDQSNFDPKYLRNRIRHKLMPFLKKHFSTDCGPALNRLALIMRDEETFWESAVAEAMNSVATDTGNTSIILKASGLAALHPALARRLVRHVVARLTGTLKRTRLDHVEFVLALARSPRFAGTLHLAHNVRVVREHNRIVFRLGELSVRPPFRVQIEKPGTVLVSEIGSILRLSPCNVEDVKDGLNHCRSATALFDMETISFPLVVRSFRRGDRFIPLGMSGSQKVKDFFINEKVPRSERMACPLLLSEGQIIWVGGHRISDRVKITERTRMARHESAGISGIFRAFATQPGGMHRRLKCEVISARALSCINNMAKGSKKQPWPFFAANLSDIVECTASDIQKTKKQMIEKGVIVYYVL